MILLPAVVLMFAWWHYDRVTLTAEAVKWQCRFELIDPIRAEADVPLSECCREWLKQ
jgi:hypothetical protein